MNGIMAGAFLTDISDAWPREFRASVEATTAMGRAGRPEEIVGAALFLTTDQSTYATGAVLRLDGGTR